MNCSTLRERTAGSPPSTSQVSLRVSVGDVAIGPTSDRSRHSVSWLCSFAAPFCSQERWPSDRSAACRCPRKPRAWGRQPTVSEKGGVVRRELRSGLQSCLGSWSHHCTVVSGFACSVSSLSQCPDHHLPDHPSLRQGDLADHWFD